MKLFNNQLFKASFKLFSWISAARKRDIYFLILLSVVVAVLELFSLMSVGPILAILDLDNNTKFQLIPLLGSLKKSDFIILISSLFIFLISITSFIKIKTIAFGHYLSAITGYELGDNLLKNYLGQSYENRINYSGSEVINTFAVHLTLAAKMLNFILQLFVAFFSSLLILIFIIYKSPIITIGTFFSIIFAYIFVGKKYKNILIRDSEISKKALDNITGLIQEINSNTEKTILEYKDLWYLKRFKESDITQRMAGKRIRNYGTLPRYIIESVGLVSFSVLTVIYALLSEDNISQIFALLGTIIFGIQKLLPSINQIYNSWANMNVCIPSIKSIDNLISEDSDKNRIIDSKQTTKKSWNTISLVGIDYKYNDEDKFVISNKSLIIRKGEKILLKGKSGAGKSTLVQIISTLIKPQKGEIKIDNLKVGIDIKESDWRKQIGYVKQKPKLFGETIIDLILGNEKNILSTKKALNKAKNLAKLSCIDDFIESLPNKYYEETKKDDTFLSGGQSQRIAIANALSTKPSLLILDESTVGIDKETEKEIINNLMNQTDLTLICISHSKNVENYFKKIIKL